MFIKKIVSGAGGRRNKIRHSPAGEVPSFAGTLRSYLHSRQRHWSHLASALREVRMDNCSRQCFRTQRAFESLPGVEWDRDSGVASTAASLESH